MTAPADDLPPELREAARLAGLDLDPAGDPGLAAEWRRLLAAFAVLAEIEVEGVEPLLHPVPLPPRTRPDRPAACLGAARLLAAAPSHDGACFLLPRVVDRGT